MIAENAGVLSNLDGGERDVTAVPFRVSGVGGKVEFRSISLVAVIFSIAFRGGARKGHGRGNGL